MWPADLFSQSPDLATSRFLGGLGVPGENILRPGHRVIFRLLEDGTVLLEPETVDLRSLRGALQPTRKGISVEDMERAIRAGAGQP